MHPIAGNYNDWLVALSFVVAILTSYTAVDVAGRVTANHGRSHRAWLAGGALAMGSGIWCMHYIGMLAFHLPIPIYYHVPTVALSLLAAVLASFTALYVVSRARMTRRLVALGSLVMGAGIAAMHYIGMAAMRLQAMHEYHLLTVALSILLAVTISCVGLTLIFYMRDENRGQGFKWLVALALGLAIPIMHYTGMAAVSFRSMPGRMNYTDSVDISALALFAIFAVTGVILGMALITSIVDRRLSQQHGLLEDERKILRALIDNIPDCMYVKDADGRFLLANLQLAMIMGVSDPQMLIGKSDADFYPPELARRYREDELRVMRSGGALYEHEEDGLDAYGKIVPMLTTKVALHDSSGQVSGIVGVGRDISERRNCETVLREAERKYRIIFNEAPVGMFRLNRDGKLLHVNPAMSSILGYTSPEDMLAMVTGSLWSTAVSPGRMVELIGDIVFAGNAHSFEVEIFRKDGDKIWISFSLRTTFEAGLAAGWVGVCEDITAAPRFARPVAAGAEA